MRDSLSPIPPRPSRGGHVSHNCAIEWSPEGACENRVCRPERRQNLDANLIRAGEDRGLQHDRFYFLFSVTANNAIKVVLYVFFYTAVGRDALVYIG